MQDCVVYRERPGSRPLVLLHGFTGSPASWRGVARALMAKSVERRGSTILALALPGHSPRVTVARGWAGNIDHLAARLRAVEARGTASLPALVCGYSLGARTALGLAVRHPELVSRLILIGAHPGLTDENLRAERRARDQNWIDLLSKSGIEAFVNAWETHPIFATQTALDDEARRAQRRIRLSHSAEALAASLQHMGLGQMPDYRQAMANLAMPALMVTGERDDKFTQLALALTRDTGIAHLSIPECGHNAVLERPDAVAELLVQVVES